MREEKTQKNLLPGLIGVISLAAVAVWQFYAFVTFKDETGLVDLQGGRLHLWLAVGLGLLACIAAFFILSVFLRHDRSDEMHITTQPS
jgi:hypothetical protein